MSCSLLVLRLFRDKRATGIAWRTAASSIHAMVIPVYRLASSRPRTVPSSFRCDPIENRKHTLLLLLRPAESCSECSISRWFGAVCCLIFLQAEDGIRYADVTGVQTCALPI